MAQVINKRFSEASKKVDKNKLQDIKKVPSKNNLVSLRYANASKNVAQPSSKASGRVAKKKI